jgi:hypothetical protein
MFALGWPDSELYVKTAMEDLANVLKRAAQKQSPDRFTPVGAKFTGFTPQHASHRRLYEFTGGYVRNAAAY